MKRTSIFSIVSLLALLSAAQVFADIARPKPSASPVKEGKIVLHTGLTIAPDSKASEARLQISRDELQTLRDALARADTSASLGQRITHSSTRTIIAGLFLFLSVSFAGVWLARSSQRRSRKAIGAALLAFAVIGGATIITRANAGPPGYVRWRALPQALAEGRETSGGLDIEIVPGEGYMKLVIPVRKSPKPNGEE